MAEANLQGPNGPHRLQAEINPLERAEGEPQEPADPGLFTGPGAAPALEDEPAE